MSRERGGGAAQDHGLGVAPPRIFFRQTWGVGDFWEMEDSAPTRRPPHFTQTG